jgi:hypothetical protein
MGHSCLAQEDLRPSRIARTFSRTIYLDDEKIHPELQAGMPALPAAIWHTNCTSAHAGCSIYHSIASFSVSLVERAACSFEKLIKPHKQAGSMFY